MQNGYRILQRPQSRRTAERASVLRHRPRPKRRRRMGKDYQHRQAAILVRLPDSGDISRGHYRNRLRRCADRRRRASAGWLTRAKRRNRNGRGSHSPPDDSSAAGQLHGRSASLPDPALISGDTGCIVRRADAAALKGSAVRGAARGRCRTTGFDGRECPDSRMSRYQGQGEFQNRGAPATCRFLVSF